MARTAAQRDAALDDLIKRVTALEQKPATDLSLYATTAQLTAEAGIRAAADDALGSSIALDHALIVGLDTRVDVLEGGDPPPVIPPGPDPSTRPWPAPVTTRTVDVPSTIKADGSVDVSAALNQFLGTVPDGSIIRWNPNATYRLDKGLLHAGRNNLIHTGNARLLARGSGRDEAASPFLLRGSNHIQIDPFRVEGPYNVVKDAQGKLTEPYPGQFGELAHILSLSGWYGVPPSSFVEMHGVTGGNIEGDFAYFEGENVGAHRPSHHVWITDCDFSTCGRNGMSPINVTDVLVERNKFDRMAYHAFDCEPNLDIEQTGRITVQNNTFGEYAARAGLIGYAFQFYSPKAALGFDLSFLNNTVAGIAANGYNQTPRGLHSKFLGNNKRLKNIRVEGNTSPRTGGEQPVIYVNAADGVVVRNNGGATFRADSSTGVVTA